MKRKILSVIISIAMCMALLPTFVFAADGEVVGDETIRFEAENYAPGGNRVDDGDASKWSNGKAAGSIAINASIEVETAGVYDISVKWGNRYGDNRNVELKVNEKVLFSGQTGITYSTAVRTYTTELSAGTNTISISSPNNVMSNFRIDYFEISPSSVSVLNNNTLRLEAESYPDGTLYTNEDAGFSNGLVARSTKMRASIYVAYPGVYKVDARWGNSLGDNRNVELKVNENVLFSGQTGIKYGVSVQSFAVELSKGISTITIVSPDNNIGNFWIDYIEFSPVTNLVTLAKEATVKIEAEDYTSGTPETINTAYNLSGGYRVLNSDIEVNVYAEEAGTYEIKAAWGSKDGNTSPVVMLGGVATDVKATFAYWKTAVTHGNVTLNKGINSIKIAKGSKLWVDYIKISPAPTLSAEKSLRLEAEDYTTANALSTKYFESGNAYVYNNNTIVSEFSVAEGGEYTMTLASGGISGDHPAISVTIDGTEVFNGSSGVYTKLDAANLSADTECIGLNQTKVTLSGGTHTMVITPGLHALVDYVEFSKPANYSEEQYPYYLAPENVDSDEFTGALTSTYLGAYSGENDETMLNSAVKALDENMSFVYWPFTTSVPANYYLKVTYASADNSAAVCMVDPQILPTVTDKDYATVLESATAVASTTWQKAYSNEAGEFSAPYFTEKYFNVGALSAGDHNFAFMYNPSDGTNKGVSIRKVELISADNMEEGLISSEAQFAAEAVGDSDSASSAKLVGNVAEANTYSSESVNDSDKNTTTVIKHVYNNSSDVIDFTFIAATYDVDGRLIGIGMSKNFTLGKGGQADIKVKANTDGASSIKTFGFNMENLRPILECELFGK